jgi:hypothetical protein
VEELMLWESVVGFVVFSVLVLFLGPEWWSSSLGALKEQKRKEQEKRKADEERSKPEK